MGLTIDVSNRVNYAKVVPPSPTYKGTSGSGSSTTTPPDTPSTPSRLASSQQRTFDALAVQRKFITRSLQALWHESSTPPPPAQCEFFAVHTRNETSWKPLRQLAYGTTTRAAALVSSHFAAGAGARLFCTPSGAAPIDFSAALDAKAGDPAIFVTCLAVALASCAGSASSAMMFAKDTKKIDQARGRISFAYSLLGECLITVSVWLRAVYKEEGTAGALYAAAAPKFIGLNLITLRQPYSFCCSELIHGDTPGKHRIHLGTHFFSSGLAVLAASTTLTQEEQVSPWANEVIFAVCISLLVFSNAISRTDVARFRAEISGQIRTTPPRT